LQSVDELFEFMETWVFAISFATCQPGNRSEYVYSRPADSSGPTYAEHHPFFVIGSLC